MRSKVSDLETLSIVIPWCNRSELETTLGRNRREFQLVDAEVIVVNCAGDAATLEGAIEKARCGRVRLANIPAPEFNKSLALNLGAHMSSGTVLFLLDADIVLDKGFLKEALTKASVGCYVSLDRVIESAPATSTEPAHLFRMIQNTELMCRNGKVVRFENDRVYFEDRSRGGPGLVMLRAHDFGAVGGMNSQLSGWGFEDLDLHVRLNAELDLSHVVFGHATHMSHGDDKRKLSGTTKSASQQLNLAICYRNYAGGNFKGTLAADIAQWSARVWQTG